MLDISYAGSPIVAQERPSPLGTRVLGGGDETPTLRDWFDFGHGPGPGERAPDVRFDEEAERSPRLFESLDTRLHTLLMFDGATASEAGYRGFVELARRIEARLPGLVAITCLCLAVIVITWRDPSAGPPGATAPSCGGAAADAPVRAAAGPTRPTSSSTAARCGPAPRWRWRWPARCSICPDSPSTGRVGTP